mgnify:CR=1 FL=1
MQEFAGQYLDWIKNSVVWVMQDCAILDLTKLFSLLSCTKNASNSIKHEMGGRGIYVP